MRLASESRRCIGICARVACWYRNGSKDGLFPTRPASTHGCDREALADKLLRSTLDQVITLGFFHADPHPGNIFVLADGSLGLIDFGATGRLDTLQQSAITDILFAMAQRDVRLLHDGVEQVTVSADGSPPTSSSVHSPVSWPSTSDRVPRSIRRVMQELVTTLAQFDLQLPADIVLLSRALVTLDGTLRVLCPGRSLMTAFVGLLSSPDDSLIDRERWSATSC